MTVYARVRNEISKQRVMILRLLEIIFSECLHNQKPAITFVLSSYLLKAPVSKEPI
jgi:hypothetical protein